MNLRRGEIEEVRGRNNDKLPLFSTLKRGVLRAEIGMQPTRLAFMATESSKADHLSFGELAFDPRLH